MKQKYILGFALFLTGLSAGVFYAFSTAINPAFVHLSDQNYILAMQAINRDIQNPIFFVSFFGAAVFLPWAAYMFRGGSSSLRFKLLAAASILYMVGVFGVTSGANVPLNDKLDRVQVHALTPAELAEARKGYQEPWGQWHMVRTVASIAAFAAIGAAVLVPERKK